MSMKINKYIKNMDRWEYVIDTCGFIATVHIFKARVKFEIIKCIISCNKIIYSTVISNGIYFNRITPLTPDLVHVFYTDITLKMTQSHVRCAQRTATDRTNMRAMQIQRPVFLLRDLVGTNATAVIGKRWILMSLFFIRPHQVGWISSLAAEWHKSQNVYMPG